MTELSRDRQRESGEMLNAMLGLESMENEIIGRNFMINEEKRFSFGNEIRL